MFENLDRYFYSVETMGYNKVVHFLNNLHYNDANDDFCNSEWCGVFMPLPTLQKLLSENMLFETLYEQVKYATDMPKQNWSGDLYTLIFTKENYLDIKDVTENTPCGQYYFDVNPDKNGYDVDSLYKKIDYFERKFGEVLYDAIQEDGNWSICMAEGVIESFRMLKTQREFEVANEILTAISGYTFDELVQRIIERDERKYIWESVKGGSYE